MSSSTSNSDSIPAEANLPAKVRQELKALIPDENKRRQVIGVMSVFSGPLPPPEYLEKYNKIVPGLAERIVKMAENQSAHRMELEKKVVTGQLVESRTGQLCGLAIGILGLLVAMVLGLTGHDSVAITVAGIDIAGIVTAFVLGKRHQASSLKKKT